MHAFLSQKAVWCLRLVSAVALGISTYLTWAALNSTGVAGCGGGIFNCDHVLSSQWSRWFQFPVGAGAAALYVCVIGALGFCGTRASDRQRRLAHVVLTVCGLTAGLAAIWFIGLQVFVIGHFCSYCLVAHTCGLVIAATILWHRPIAGRPTAILSSVSFAGVVVLIGGQLLTPAPQKWQAEFHVVQQDSEFASPEDAEGDLFDAPVFDAPSLDTDDLFEAPEFDDDNQAIELTE